MRAPVTQAWNLQDRGGREQACFTAKDRQPRVVEFAKRGELSMRQRSALAMGRGQGWAIICRMRERPNGGGGVLVVMVFAFHRD